MFNFANAMDSCHKIYILLVFTQDKVMYVFTCTLTFVSMSILVVYIVMNIFEFNSHDFQ